MLCTPASPSCAPRTSLSTTMGIHSKIDEWSESVRAERRDVYFHENWTKHRSSGRYLSAISQFMSSYVLKTLLIEVGVFTAFAAFLVFWNCMAGSVTNLAGVTRAGPWAGKVPLLTASMAFWNLTAPTLGLLITFRFNNGYSRWDEARKLWGSVVNQTRNFVRQANAYFKTEDAELRTRTQMEVSAFTRCLRTFLRGAEDVPKLREELKELGFSSADVERYVSNANRPFFALSEMSATVRKAKIDPILMSNFDRTSTTLADNVGAMERIFRSPIPLVYTRHTARFLSFWLLTLPLGLWTIDSSWNKILTIPVTAIISFFMLGVETLGVQLEEPFSILPLEALCDTSIGAVLKEMTEKETLRRESDPVAA